MKHTFLSRGRAVLLTLVLTLAGIFAATVATPGSASAAPLPTKCTDMFLKVGGGTIKPYVTVPVCYNGISIWRNGNVTPGADTFGWDVNYLWWGTYNDSSQTWIGVGENFQATQFTHWASSLCYPRWMIDQYGQVFSAQKNC